MTNPYDTNNFPGKFEITYIGEFDGHYAFKIARGSEKGMDFLMFEQELSQWLFDETFYDWYMGNQIIDKDAPHIPEHVQKDIINDTMVVFSALEDVVLFERNFTITGATPTL